MHKTREEMAQEFEVAAAPVFRNVMGLTIIMEKCAEAATDNDTAACSSGLDQLKTMIDILSEQATEYLAHEGEVPNPYELIGKGMRAIVTGLEVFVMGGESFLSNGLNKDALSKLRMGTKMVKAIILDFKAWNTILTGDQTQGLEMLAEAGRYSEQLRAELRVELEEVARSRNAGSWL